MAILALSSHGYVGNAVMVHSQHKTNSLSAGFPPIMTCMSCCWIRTRESLLAILSLCSRKSYFRLAYWVQLMCFSWCWSLMRRIRGVTHFSFHLIQYLYHRFWLSGTEVRSYRDIPHQVKHWVLGFWSICYWAEYSGTVRLCPMLWWEMTSWTAICFGGGRKKVYTLCKHTTKYKTTDITCDDMILVSCIHSKPVSVCLNKQLTSLRETSQPGTTFLLFILFRDSGFQTSVNEGSNGVDVWVCLQGGVGGREGRG